MNRPKQLIWHTGFELCSRRIPAVTWKLGRKFPLVLRVHAEVILGDRGRQVLGKSLRRGEQIAGTK